MADVKASPMGATSLEFESPESPWDLLRWKGLDGIQFTKLHVIELYKKLSQGVETDDHRTRGDDQLAGVRCIGLLVGKAVECGPEADPFICVH